MSKRDDDKEMLGGIEKLLNKDYEERAPVAKCEHESDGFIYDESDTTITYKCAKCGINYEIRKR